MKKLRIEMAAVAMAALALASCNGEDPVEAKGTNNPNLPVGVLFEVDGCKVYRFTDAGRYIYFANCPGTVQSFKPETCGKNCTRHIPVVVTTNLTADERAGE